MQCWQCHATVRRGAKICIYCGARLTDDAFDADDEYSREQAVFGAERQPAPEYHPGGERDQRNGRSRDAANPSAVPSPGRGLLSGLRGRRTEDRDAPPPPRGTDNPRSRSPEPGERPRQRSDESDGYRDGRDRDERGDVRGRHDDRAEPLVDDHGGGRRPSRPVGGDGWSAAGEAGRERRSTRSPARDEWNTYGDDRSDRERGDYRRGGERGYAEYDAPRRDEYYGGRDDRGGRPRHDDWDEPPPPGLLEDDSWGLPALTGPEARVQGSRQGSLQEQGPEQGWTDEWQAAAGPADQWAPPRQPGRRAPNWQDRRRGRSPAGPPRKKGGRGPIVTLLLVVALVVIAGGALLGSGLLRKLTGGTSGPTVPAFATYTPGPTPTSVAGFKEYKSTQSQFVLNYPQAWSQSSANDTSQGQPDYLDTFAGSSASMVVERTPGFDPVADLEIIQGEVRGGQQAGLSFTESTAAAGVFAIGGEQWTRREYDVTGKNGKEHMAIFACHHLGHGYAIVLRSPTDQYAQLYSASFKIMLNTFRFTA